MHTEDDLRLNAYIDNELSAEQQAELLQAIQHDPALARRVCELGNLKKQVRLAYAELPQPAAPARTRTGSRWAPLVAGVLLLALGGLSGWLVHAVTQPERFVVLDPSGRGQAPATADAAETRIVFHLNDPSQAKAGDLLDEVEHLLQAYEADGRPLRVEIVGHGEGLGLLRERLSTHKARVRELARRYENLTFVACLNTMERLRVEHGIEVKLLPEAEVTRSGVSHVVKRRRDGWAYIRV